MRWVIGDVHGCARELERLLREIRFEAGKDELWSIGDLINRGPDSLEVLRLWRALEGRGILGNHELYALAVRAGRAKRRADQLDELFGSSEGEELLARVGELPLMVRFRLDAPETWLVHAGVHPRWTDLEAAAIRLNATMRTAHWFDDPEVAFATRVRCCTADGERQRHTGGAHGCPPGSMAWDALYTGTARIVHGHWAARGFYRGERTMSLDSGCVYGGALTAWCPDDERTVWVESHFRY